MTMRTIATLMAIVSLNGNANAQQPLAIQCEGPLKITNRETKKTTVDDSPRIYIIDEDKRDILYWNATFGKSFSLCGTYEHECRFDFSPGLIMSKTKSVGPDSMHVIVDRKAGAFWEISYSILGSTEYEATCRKTDMPVFDPAERKF